MISRDPERKEANGPGLDLLPQLMEVHWGKEEEVGRQEQQRRRWNFGTDWGDFLQGK